jgi:uncharacterized repeat protein (TIGR01451 family)/fimbrial isopeptide formation D2 family protein
MASRGIWAFMSARTRRSLTLTWTALFVLSLLLQYFTFATAAPVLAVHDENFQLDGNATDEGPGDDWDHHPGADAFKFVHESGDVSIFTTGGSKDVNDTTQWAWTNGSVPDKDNLLDGFAALENKILYFGADRYANNGDSAIGFWFFKNGINVNPNGSFSPAHTVGDLFVVSHFENGGAASEIVLYEWVGSGGSDGALNLVASGQICTAAPANDEACGIANQDAVAAPWSYTPKVGPSGTFPQFSFFEGGLDLNDVFDGNPPCFSSFLIETRSSQEPNAQLKDFIAGDFNTCVPPTIATTSQKSSADFGETVHDSATFSGSNGAVTGTATFFICTPAQVTAAGCPSGAGSQVGSPVTIANGSATSANYTVGLTSAAVGKYCWRVVYTPDAASQYLAGSHTNATTECFTVAPATIAITKVANPAGPVNAGDPIGFDITVTNTGTGTALNVAVNDPLPAGVDWTLGTVTGGASCQITGAVGSEVLSCTKASLAAGASFSAHISGPTDPADCPSVTNADAHVTTSNDGDAHASASVTVNCPDVTVAKTPDAGSVNAGGTATFTIVVTNLGPGLAKNVTLHDPLPAGIDWSDDSAQCDVTGAVGSQVLDCNFGDLAPNQPITIHVSGLTDKNDCGPLNNTATVAASNEAAAQNGNNSDSGKIEVLCADIGIAKTANPAGPVNAGDTIGFDVAVTNAGNGSATDVHVSDPLPTGVTWVLDAVTGDTAGVTCNVTGAPGSQALTCDDDTMPAGASFTVHVSADTDASDCATITNTATVTSGNDGGGQATASVVVQCPDVTVTKTADNSPILPGDTAAFTITVNNAGPGTASNVHVEDQLPGDIAWAISPAVAGCVINGSTLTCDFASLAPNSPIVIHVSGATDNGDCGPLPNTVTVSASNEPESATDNNSANAEIVVECADVSVEKTADADGPISAGETAAFTVTVTNNGPDTAVNVVVDDTLPAGVAWTVSNVTLNGSAIANPCDPISGGVLHCDLGDLANGDVVQIHIGGDTDFQDCGTLHNTVTIGVDNEPAGADGNNDDAADQVVNCPVLGIAKTADHSAPVVIGSQIGFTITVANNGEGTAFNVHVSDALDADFSWSIASQTGALTWSLVGNQLTATGDLPPGTSSVHVVANTDAADSASQCGLVPNTAFLTQGETPVDDDSAAEEVRCPEIGIDKTSDDADGAVDAGQTVTFTILATVAEGPVTDAVITDTLPAGETYVDGTQHSTPAATSFTKSADGRTLTWTYASLNDGDPAVTITYDVTIDAAAVGDLTNVAELCVSEVPNCESADETVSPNPELGIAKSNDAPLVAGLPTAKEGDTVTYTLDYTVKGTVHNAVITDVLPAGVTYTNLTASSDAQFTFQSYNPVTRTLTWTADVVSENGSLTYDATIDEGAAELAQPLTNKATIDSQETEPASDTSDVFVAPLPLALTPPPTDTLAPSATPSNPGFTLMLILIAVAVLALGVGFITPVPEHVRRRDRLG